MLTKTHQDIIEKRTATFSDCEKYRYTLEIVWNDKLGLMHMIALNPSTADERQDDPTLRRVKSFAHLWGYGGIIMTNLFAFRSTDPKIMRTQTDPIGSENNRLLLETRDRCPFAIAGWGNHGAFMDRGNWVRQNIRDLHCFRLTQAGQPEHPLYMPGNIKPIALV
jgi:hypothetical protein